MTVYCVDDRHGTPCPQPPNADRCDGCAADGCDSTRVVEADSPQDAARAAGWSEAYIADAFRHEAIERIYADEMPDPLPEEPR